VEAGTESFTLEYMEAVILCFNQYGWKRVTQRYKRVKHYRYISRFKEYIEQNGTDSQKLKKLHELLWDRFTSCILKREIMHDFDLKRWALQIAKEVLLNNFKASDSWLLLFKKSIE
jgi:hypothetical protein